MASSNTNNKSIMEKTNQVEQPQPPPPLKCPRCDSSNTKFCYYNNYSLSQPRHFCKSCKRYWTRGGTLRNVPVGGGCRKNKRVKRHPAPSSSDMISSSSSTATSLQPPPRIDLSPPPSSNPLFYTLPTIPPDPNFPFSRFRVSSGLDFLPQINCGLGLGFSSSGLMANDVNMTSSSQMLTSAGGGNLNPIFFGSSNNFSPSSTMASLLASSFQQQKFSSGGFKNIQDSNSSFSGLMNYDQDHMQLAGGNETMGKDGHEWNGGGGGGQSHFHHGQINNVSDSSSILWNTSNIGAWLDPSNMGSSVPSLI